jgi:hypothetical protein
LYYGTADQSADVYFTAFYAEQLPPPPLKYTAYSFVQAHIHGSTFSTVPSFSAEIRGFLCEAGEEDANPIRVAYDWLRNSRYAMGLPAEMFDGDPDTNGVDSTLWKDETDYCDELVNYTNREGASATEPRFRYSNYIEEAIKGYDFLTDLMTSCRGILRWRNGKIEPFIEKGDQTPDFYYSDRVSLAFTTGGGTTDSRIYADFSAYPNLYWRGAVGNITLGGEKVQFGVKDSTTTYIDLCLALPSSPGTGVSFTLIKDNIKEGTFNFKELGDLNVPNVVRVEFQRRKVWNTSINQYENEYQWDAIEQEVPELYTWSNSGLRQNVKKIKTVRYSGIKRSTQAMRMAQFLADTAYFSRWMCQFTTGLEGYMHAVGDVIGITKVEAAWSNKWFRIASMEELEGHEIQLNCIEYNPACYNDTVNVQNYEPNYDDQGGSAWSVPGHVERFRIYQDLSVVGQYKFYVFFKRPDNYNYWYGAKIWMLEPILNGTWIYLDTFTIPSPSVLLSSGINSSQTSIPFDPVSLYGSFPTAGRICIEGEFIDYTGISGNQFTGCSRGWGAWAHNAGDVCSLVQNETPYLLSDNTYAGNEITFRAISFVAAGTSAPADSAPTWPMWIQANDPPPPFEGGS